MSGDWIIAHLVPPADQTLLLRACLLSGEGCRAAWEDWRRRVGSPKAAITTGDSAIKVLLPQLQHNLTENGIVPDRETRAILKAAAVYEERRFATLDRLCAEALHLLGPETVVLQGPPVAKRVLPVPWLRHYHSLDVWMPSPCRASVLARATAAGYRLSPPDGDGTVGEAVLHDPAGLEIRIDFDSGPLGISADVFDAGIHTEHAADLDIRLLPSSDMWLTVFVYFLCRGPRERLSSACDAWHLLDRFDADWRAVASRATGASLGWHMEITLSYLREALGASLAVERLSRGGTTGLRPNFPLPQEIVDRHLPDLTSWRNAILGARTAADRIAALRHLAGSSFLRQIPHRAIRRSQAWLRRRFVRPAGS